MSRTPFAKGVRGEYTAENCPTVPAGAKAVAGGTIYMNQYDLKTRQFNSRASAYCGGFGAR